MSGVDSVVLRPAGLTRLDGQVETWRGVNGAIVTDDVTLERLRRLAIPPAWTHVWASSDPDAAVQATGLDARGRTQYRYSLEARARADENKFSRMLEFAEALPALRQTVQRHLTAPVENHTTLHRVVASVVRLLDFGLFRIGNERYAKSNHTYGLLTLRRRHVRVSGSVMNFEFVGKEHLEHDVLVEDADAAAVVRALLNRSDDPSERLFAIGAPPAQRALSSATVNSYLHCHSGQAATAKVFRTWGATVAAATVAAGAPLSEGLPRHRALALNAFEAAAEVLGDTPAVARASYVHPAALSVGTGNAVREAVERVLTDKPAATYRSAMRDPTVQATVLKSLLTSVKANSLMVKQGSST
ncbi:DNA topoisomerase IB [Curtobacterium sp. MCBD17_030]|nr:DNA topoisomerase IB [Curtobacterium sp. MCBD17_030]